MAFNPTPDQKRAIETRDRSVLLSAAAGSGKTATLTQRIIESITSKEAPLSIDEMLIVTFTRAAAAELRERISSALTAALAEDPTDPHLTHQTVILGSADISTIDSFCLNVVKANFERLSLSDGSPLPPDFRLADDTELKTIALNVMNSVIDKWYEKTDDGLDFPKFAENFGTTRGEGTIIETLIKYASMLKSVSDPYAFTKNYADSFMADADRDFFDSALGKRLNEYLKKTLDHFINILDQAISDLSEAAPNYVPAFEADLELCRSALNALDVSYERTREVFNSYSPLTLGRIKKDEQNEITNGYKELRTQIKTKLRALAEKYFSISQTDLAEMSRRIASELYVLSDVITDFNREYSKEKLLRHICEFSDITSLAHKLLVGDGGEPTDVALSLREKYKAVYIDEYQDVDPVQDEIFRAISNVGVGFTVGDIKQSIYGFRGAEPSIFGNMRRKMPDFGTPESDEAHAASLFMSENFRCDETIIDFVNEVSAHTLVPAGGVVGYRAEDDLKCKKNAPGHFPVQVALFTNKKDEDGNSPEVLYVVNEVKRLLMSGIKNDGKKYKKSDIAILCRSRSLLNIISDMLNSLGIETVDESAKDFFGNPEILMALALVSAIDNPQKDIPLAAVMRSPFFGFSMDELLKIRKSAGGSLFDAIEFYKTQNESEELAQKCGNFLDRINNLRIDSRSLPVDRFVRQLYKEFGIMSLSDKNAKRDPAQISANLRRFYEYSRTYTSTGLGGLSGFISYINGIIETKGRVEAPNVISSDGAVTLLTIHKSKGLEFPAVFVVGCGKTFNRDDFKNSLIFDPGEGVALRPVDDTGFARIDTPHRATLETIIKEKQTEEEMRILYVALTRARERLIVTSASRSDPQKLLDEARFASQFECRASVLSANSFVNWIAHAVANEKPFFEIHVDEEIENVDYVKDGDTEETVTYGEQEAAAREIFAERFDYNYPYAYAEKLPAKLSVSKLYPEILDDDGASNLDLGKLPELREKPLFLMGETKASAAEKGTATHVFMQFCDFERAEKGVRDELARLVSEKFIPKGTAELVNIRQLEAFFESRFYKTVKSATKIYRELRFNLLLPASEFTSSEELSDKLKEEKLLVQGVIDLLMIDANGNTVLCDYKTDHLTSSETADESLAKKKLFERHGQQLKYYAAAAKELFGKAPDRICIYSLPLGRAIDMD